MKYPKDIVKALYPYLDKPLENEWELIKNKKSILSRQQRDNITKLCLELESES